MMKTVTRKVAFDTEGRSDVVDVTPDVAAQLESTGLVEGFALLFVAGATAGLTTLEYEPGLVADLQHALERMAPAGADYAHNVTHMDGNGHSHVRASLLGPSLSIPFENGRLCLGQWQQIVFVDCDNRPRQRKLVVQFVGAA